MASSVGAASVLNPPQYLLTLVRGSIRFSRPIGLWQFYREAGYRVECYHNVLTLPKTLREERVSRLRSTFRLGIFLEMGVSTVSGPLAPFIGLPLLAMILLKWTIDIGWCYGLDMRDPRTQREVGYVFLNDFNQIVFEKDSENVMWKRLGTTFAQLLLMGWGQELKWADQIMAKIRGELRDTTEKEPGCTSCACTSHSLRNSCHSRSDSGFRGLWGKTIKT